MPGNTPMQCLVCGGISYGYHFGILACRACAAFFRRTVAENKTYKCRNNYECAVNKEEGLRNMCRACRFRKCEEFGMDRNDVQMNRDPIGKKQEREASPKLSESSTSVSTPTNSAIITVIGNSDRSTYAPSNPPISIVPYTNLNHLSTLERLKQGYNVYHTSQKSLYNVLYPNEFFSEEHFKLVTYTEFVKMERGCVSLRFSMLNDFFLPYNTLDKKTKILIFQAFNLRFHLLNSTFCSHQKGPSLPISCFQLHYGQYLDQDNMETFLQGMPYNLPMDQCFLSNCRKLRKVFMKFDFDETEVAGVSGIMLWDEAALLMPQWQPGQKAREQIFLELHGYLISKHGPSGIGARMANLIWIIHEISKCAREINEQRTIDKIFNPMSTESLWDEFAV